MKRCIHNIPLDQWCIDCKAAALMERGYVDEDEPIHPDGWNDPAANRILEEKEK